MHWCTSSKWVYQFYSLPSLLLLADFSAGPVLFAASLLLGVPNLPTLIAFSVQYNPSSDVSGSSTPPLAQRFCKNCSLLSLHLCLYSPSTDTRSNSVLPFRNLFILGDFNSHHLLFDSKSSSDPRGEEVFEWATSSDLILISFDTHTLFYSSSIISPLLLGGALEF